MKVYVMSGAHDYEGSVLLGVYSSEEHALKAKEDFLKYDEYDSFDKIEIQSRVLDGVANW